MKNIGKNIAVISDAGTPCINDPGTYIIKKAIDNNIDVIPVCGASAVITALSISGFDITTFSFLGFIPRTNKEQDELFTSIKNSDFELFVLYESPKRIRKSLEIIDENLNNPEVCLCNDLTKKYQRIYRGTTKDVINELDSNPNFEKGEYVLIVKYLTESHGVNFDITNEAILIDIMVKEKCNLKDAVNIAKDKYKLNKNDLYDASLNIKKMI